MAKTDFYAIDNAEKAACSCINEGSLCEPMTQACINKRNKKE